MTQGGGVRKDGTEAVKWYRKAADRNLALAQYQLGTCYFYGRGVAKDEVEAVGLYRRAAEQNLAAAQFALESLNLKTVCKQNKFQVAIFSAT
jgi:TPR repeat protein